MDGVKNDQPQTDGFQGPKKTSKVKIAKLTKQTAKFEVFDATRELDVPKEKRIVINKVGLGGLLEAGGHEVFEKIAKAELEILRKKRSYMWDELQKRIAEFQRVDYFLTSLEVYLTEIEGTHDATQADLIEAYHIADDEAQAALNVNEPEQ
jgi:hypothetical protein